MFSTSITEGPGVPLETSRSLMALKTPRQPSTTCVQRLWRRYCGWTRRASFSSDIAWAALWQYRMRRPMRSIMAVGLISAADLGGRIPHPLSRSREQAEIKGLSAAYVREGMAPLSGCTPEGLAQETLANATQWSFMAKVDSLKSRPFLIVTADDAYKQGKPRVRGRIAPRRRQPGGHTPPAYRPCLLRSARCAFSSRAQMARNRGLTSRFALNRLDPTWGQSLNGGGHDGDDDDVPQKRSPYKV